jgi:dipeptidase D
MRIRDIDDLLIWKYFEEITAIPRPSKREGKIREYLENFGHTHGLETHTDDAGNVLIRKPATPGYEDHTPVILQSHMDMVCAVVPGKSFNCDEDPVPAYVEGNWVKSDGTTLGADDGVGVAAALAVLAADDLQHPPLETLFTVDEESGMTGARNLKSGWLKGKMLINLDSEDEGELFIGCAGGQDTTALFHMFFEAVPENMKAWKLTINGLTGGHSGDEIHKGRANAIKLAVRILWTLTDTLGIGLSRLTGGTLRNALPPEAKAVFVVAENKQAEMKLLFEQFAAEVRKEYEHTDPAMKLELSPATMPAEVMPEERQRDLLLSLYSCWHGVYSWSPAIPGLVQTSTNLALVRQDGGKVIVETSQRSSLESEKEYMSETVASAFRLAGATVSFGDGYPGWTPNPESPILQITRESYQALFGEEPAVKAIHAGLECGLFLEQYPEMDMISFGPTIRGAHTPEEKLDIPSTRKFWQLLTEVLKRI